MDSKTKHSVLEWTDEELRLIKAVRKDHSFCSPQYKGTSADLNRIWLNIANEVRLPAYYCRKKWSMLKSKYVKIKINKINPPVRSKYLDGKLSFLDKFYVQQTDVSPPSPAIYDVMVIDSDEEIGDGDKEFMVLDLEIIDKLLLKREQHEDIEMARMEEILSIVSKRIEETLVLNQHLNEIKTQERDTEPEICASETSNSPPFEINTPDVIELDDDSDCQSASQSPEGDDTDEEISSDNLRNAILAFPNPPLDKTKNTSRIPIASMSIPVPQKPPQKSDDMETAFDIHRRSDTKTFCQELGKYINRLSKEKQEEIRLKICCVVTEAELEEMG